MEQQGEIVLYQPETTFKLEVRLENETVWLTQAQIAELFGTGRQAITKHLKNIFNSNELEEKAATVKNMNNGEQKQVPFDNVAEYIPSALKNN